MKCDMIVLGANEATDLWKVLMNCLGRGVPVASTVTNCNLSHCMGKPTIYIGENKVADQLIGAFVFATGILQFLYFINPNFPASSHLL